MNAALKFPLLPLANPEQGVDGVALLRHAITAAFAGRIAVTSSFGAESAVLLALVAEIDPATPVLFLETGQHFPETLDYERKLTAYLGLKDVRRVAPRTTALQSTDPDGELWRYDTDACCNLRKVVPLAEAVAPFDAWITGRKRVQSATRAVLPFLELVDGKVKLNPLADWSLARIEAEFTSRALPRHPLSARGYGSIGCGPCTSPVCGGQDLRAGRWAGSQKTECGIHRAA